MERPPTRPWMWDALSLAALLPWLAERLALFGERTPLRLGLEAGGRSLTYLYVDANALWLVPTAVVWIARPPVRVTAALSLAAVTLVQAWIYGTESLARYYAGIASAYDMAEVVQPLWRAAGGDSMAATWFGDLPLWADHASYGLWLFVPFSRLFDDAGTGVLVAQAAFAAAWLPALYLLGRALGLATGVSLLVVCVAAATRAMLHATLYDFHPECDFPVAFVLAVTAYERKRFGWALAFAVVAASSKEMATLTVAGAAVFLAVARRDRRAGTFALACFAAAAFGMFALPRLTGWASYVGLYGGHEIDLTQAVASTGMRALHTMLLGWLHPFSWFAGAPWIAAAAVSAKIAVKGVDYQYGFLHVPVALVATLYALRFLQRRGTSAGAVALVWALAAVSVNGQRTLQPQALLAERERFRSIRGVLHSPLVAPKGVDVATDACLAPYLMERPRLVGLCILDPARFAASGEETWTHPAEQAFTVDRLVVDPTCRYHGECLEAQLAEARRRGYAEVGRGPRLLVLARP